MPRRESPLQRDGTALVDFAADLRELRDKAGKPPYREMAARAHFSATTLSSAAGGKRLPSLAATLAFVRVCGGDPAEWARRWHELVATTATPALPDERDENAPYLGLSVYEAEDADRFFGREALVDAVVECLAERRFVAVFGPSGSGKSSVLRAGVVPRLAGPVVLFTPGAHPLEECAMRLADRVGLTAWQVREELTKNPDSLTRLAAQALDDEPEGTELVLVVDQFEEIFTLCQDSAERTAFLAALIAAAHAESSRCRVAIAVRADFFARCALHADLVAAWKDAMVTVTPMTPDELRRAIIRPARLVKCTVESELVTTLVAEVHGEAGVLPLLSHCLLETWRRRQGNALTTSSFQAAGGIHGALAQTAETVFGGLDEEQQESARALFLRLCALGDGTEDTKRRVGMAEIDDSSVLDRLIDARLLTRTSDGVEITHEALIRSWPRLRAWLDHDRDGRRLHRELTEATATWERHRRDRGSLLRGARLEVIANWAWATNAPLNKSEQRFLDESVAEDEQDYARRRRAGHRRRAMLLLQAVLLVAVLAFSALLVRDTFSDDRQEALSQWAVDEALRLEDADPALAAQVALAAYRLDPSPRAGDTLIRISAVVTRHSLGSAELRVSLPAESYLERRKDAAAPMEYALTNPALDTTTVRGRPTASFTGGAHAALTATGDLLATVDREHVVRLWRTDMSHEPATMPGRFTRVVFDQYTDSGLLLAQEANTSVLWDVSEPWNPKRKATVPGTRGAFIQPRVMSTVHADAVSIWDVTEPAEPVLMRKIPYPEAPSAYVAMSRNGWVAIAGPSGRLELWDIAHGDRPPALVQAHPGPVTAITASPDGTQVVTAGAGKIATWQVQSSALNKNAELDSHDTVVTTLGFLRGVMFAIGDDTTVQSWFLDPDLAATRVCAMIDRERISAEEWRLRFPKSPDLPFPCAGEGRVVPN